MTDPRDISHNETRKARLSSAIVAGLLAFAAAYGDDLTAYQPLLAVVAGFAASGVIWAVNKTAINRVYWRVTPVTDPRGTDGQTLSDQPKPWHG